MMQDGIISHHGIAYSIDRNVELISVVMLISNYYVKYPFLKSNLSNLYINDMVTFFRGFDDHPALNQFDALVESGFAFDVPILAILACDNKMHIDNETLNVISDRTQGKKDEISKFLQTVNQFAYDSNFDIFYESHKEYYTDVIEYNVKRCPEIDFSRILTQYYGYLPNNMSMIHSMTFGGVGYHVTLKNTSYSVLGTFTLNNGIPFFMDENNYVNMIFHETSHGYVNQLLDKIDINEDIIAKLYNLLRSDYQEHYGCGKGMLSEQVVRSITARMLSLFVSENESKKILESDKNAGFAAVEPICIALKNEYEVNRADFPTIKEFLPHIADVLVRFL